MAAYIPANGYFFRRMVTIILSSVGYRIETAEDGAAGLKLIEQNSLT
ncbi:MAG: hypothetical protein MI924_01200 [Chloroflexales bacterium]|nr:hypothetical protein [Chloroflexales bacterium]